MLYRKRFFLRELRNGKKKENGKRPQQNVIFAKVNDRKKRLLEKLT